jgi:nucleotide-binding universal stress UspA family protein
MKKIQKILVATDFSKDSAVALDDAVQLAGQLKADIYVMNVVETIQQCAVDYCLAEEQIEGEKNKLLKDAREKMNEALSRYSTKEGVMLNFDIRYGNVLDEIIREERDRNIDLIVIGQHDKNTFWKKIQPHLSDKIKTLSECDTLVARHA